MIISKQSNSIPLPYYNNNDECALNCHNLSSNSLSLSLSSISSSSSILAVPVISVSSSSLSTHHTQATPLATPTTPHATPTTLWRERASVKDSLEPLISTGSGGGARETPHPSGKNNTAPYTHTLFKSFLHDTVY